MTIQAARFGYRFGRFELQPAERRLLADGQPASVGSRALDVLLTLVERAGRLVTKDELLELVWPHLVVEENNLQSQVSWLRKILGAEAIATVQGKGYRFTLPVQRLDAELPSPADVRNHNLPRQLTSFVGREREIAAIGELLGRTQLLTLTGSGGCGKTRLSLRVAADSLGRFPDGAWFVEFAPLAEPSLVPQAVAAVLGLKEVGPGTPISRVLVEHLESKRLLLVLDSCEHLLVACAKLADAIVRRCPEVVIVATSRERFGIDGEQTYRVPSLALPGRDAGRMPQTISTCESVRLFIDRALLVRPDFRVTSASMSALASLCRHLDGMPLAIELAAARVRTLSVQEIDGKIAQRFGLLTGGSRTALPHHQTLRSLIDWSYDLLSDAERLLLQRLSVFAGGWTLDAAEKICSDEDVENLEVVNLLTSLSDKSLVVVEPVDGRFRYRFLETVRQYARERLHGMAQQANGQRRHLEHFLALAEAAEPALLGANQQAWLDRLETENGNLRSALEWALVSGEDAASGLRLAGALYRFWLTRGYLAEGRAWLAQLIAAAPHAPDVVRAKSLSAAGNLAMEQGDYPASRVLHEQSLAIARALGDKRGVASALNNLGIVAEECGDYPTAHDLHTETLAIRRELGDQWAIAASLNNLGLLAYDRRDHLSAQSLHAESLAIFRALRDRSCIATSLRNLGLVALDLGDHRSARALFVESLTLFQELGYRRGLADLLEALAFVGLPPSDATRAARIWGAAARLREVIGAPRAPNEQPRYDSRVTAARKALCDDAAFDRAWQHGLDMSLEDAIALALSADDER